MALLGACRVYGIVNIGEVNHIPEWDPGNARYYVVLSNRSAIIGKQDLNAGLKIQRSERA
jgi:hypothetical protein